MLLYLALLSAHVVLTAIKGLWAILEHTCFALLKLFFANLVKLEIYPHCLRHWSPQESRVLIVADKRLLCRFITGFVNLVSRVSVTKFAYSPKLTINKLATGHL